MLRSAAAALVLGVLVMPAVTFAKPAKHRPKKPRTSESAEWATTPSAKYGSLTKATCLTELKERKIAFTEVKEARGVLAPVRLKGPLSGVVFRTELPEAERRNSPHEVFDCRLVLALHDFGAILKAKGVEEAILFSAWRPPPKSWPTGKQATRHPGALAADVRRLIFAADEKQRRADLVVERDWTPKRDTPPCSGDVTPDTKEAKTLRSIFCEADEKRLFTVMLSPNYDTAHANHFHLEVTPGVKWRLIL